MTRTEMVDLLLLIAKDHDQETIEYLEFLYDVDITRPNDYETEKLADVIDAWADYDKGFAD